PGAAIGRMPGARCGHRRAARPTRTAPTSRSLTAADRAARAKPDRCGRQSLTAAVPSEPPAILSGVTQFWLLIGIFVGAGATLALLRSRLRALAHDARRAGELERDLVRAQADLEHERALAEERLAAFADVQERLSASFKAMSAEALQSSMGQLAELARAQLQAAQAEAKG